MCLVFLSITPLDADLTRHHRRGKLEDALELYRRAEAYVPDNIKLKERWILFVIHVFLMKLESERRYL